MKGFYWRALDTVGLMLLHRRRSVQSLYTPYSDEWEAMGREQFFIEPAIPKLQLEPLEQEIPNKADGFRFTFPSSLPIGNSSNDIVSGLCYIPDDLDKPDKSDGKHAVIVHGWRMDSLDRVRQLLLERLLRSGYCVYFLYLPHHMDRMEPTALYSGEHMVSADIPGTLHSIRQAVADIRGLIGWIRAAHSNPRVSLIGISLGGCITNLTAVVEQGIDDLVAVMYANSLAYAVWNTVPGKYIRGDMMANGVTYAKLRQYWSLLEPEAGKPMVDKQRILLLSGKHDRYVLSEDTDALWEAWERPLRKLLPFGHAGLALRQNRIAEEIISFLETR